MSCGVAPASTQDQGQADKKGKMLLSIFKKDFRYWIITKLFKKRFMTLMGADKNVVASLSSQQLKWVERLIDYMNPASLRYAGAVFDNTAPLPGDRIAAIRVPTLIIHAEDDTLQLYHNAAFAASTIPRAQLLRFATGGHLVIIVEQEIVRAAVRKHILASELDLAKP
jgi:pimeloyl-ACP methyl ester carboxylesterase